MVSEQARIIPLLIHVDTCNEWRGLHNLLNCGGNVLGDIVVVQSVQELSDCIVGLVPKLVNRGVERSNELE
jgi:hypothetical protein